MTLKKIEQWHQKARPTPDAAAFNVQLGCHAVKVPSRVADLTGKKFGRLQVVSIHDKKGRQWRWLCKCDCGKSTASFGFSLRTGKCKSCGCIAADKSKERWKNATPEMFENQRAKAAKTHSLSRHPLYRVWADMKQRCENKRNKHYMDYGGRGIFVCERWQDFKSFYDDMAPAWRQGLSIGRIDNDGAYEPQNCQWETARDQVRNRRCNVYVDTPAGRMLMVEASEKYGITAGCIRYRVSVGKKPEDVFLKPSQRGEPDLEGLY